MRTEMRSATFLSTSAKLGLPAGSLVLHLRVQRRLGEQTQRLARASRHWDTSGNSSA